MNQEAIRVEQWELLFKKDNIAELLFPSKSTEIVWIAIKKAETEDSGDIQLNHLGLGVKAGHGYAIAFRARAKCERRIMVGFAKAHEPWDGLGLYEEIELTSKWQSFEVDFVARDDDDEARIHFDLGASKVGIELDDVTLHRLPVGVKKAPKVPYLTYDHWELVVRVDNEADLLFPSGSTEMVQVAIESAKTKDSGDIQLNRLGLEVKANHYYAVTFRARADRQRDIRVGFSKAHKPWDGLGLNQEVELTSEWQSYEVDFVVMEDEENARIHFDLGGSKIGIELDDVTLCHRQIGVGKVPKVSYIICSTPRSGSNLLAEALYLQRRAGRPQEYFLYWYAIAHEPESLRSGAVRSWLVPTDKYIKKVIQQGTTPNGVFGVKIMWSYFDLVIDKLGSLPQYEDLQAQEILESAFSNLHYIHMVRNDKIRQAVSLAKATQSGKWYEVDHQKVKNEGLSDMGIDRIDFHTKSQANDLVYDYDQIAEYYYMFQEQDEAWEAYFNKVGIKPHKVVYEDLVNSYEQTVHHVLNYLKMPPPYITDVQKISQKRQSDSINEEWTQRFNEDLAKNKLHGSKKGYSKKRWIFSVLNKGK